ncbi:hypothetical protein CLAIMM_06981 [Cladophialophora immunda]|nr:hypothetical protein CLAIMM_06981 [Cladophialophora immunda]
MKRRQPDNSNDFAFDPPPAVSSSTTLGPNLYIPSTGLDTAQGSAGYASNNRISYLADMAAPFVSGNPSQAYRPAEEIDADGTNGVTNGTMGDIFGSLDTDPGPNSILAQPSDEELARLLRAYIERGPSPTQGCDEDWSAMAATSTPVNEPTGNSGTGVARSPGVAAATTTNITTTPESNVSVAPSTSPATPGSASRKLIETMSNSPIEIPRTSQFANFHPASPTPKKKFEKEKRRNGGQASTGTEGLSQSSPVRQPTPAKRKLGSPFKMPGLPASSPAKRIPTDNISMGTLYSASPAVSQSLPMDNISPGMTAVPGYSSLTNSQMQTMAGQRIRIMSASYKSLPNLPGFTNELLSSGGSSGSFLDADIAAAEPRSAKRARTDTFGARTMFTNVAREEQMHHQTYFPHIPRGTEPSGLSLAHHFNDHIVQDFKWLERDRSDPEPPPSAVARTTGYEFPIPLPSGTVMSIKAEAEAEAEEDVMVGQKRKAVHMSQGEIEADDIQDPYMLANPGIAHPEPQYLGMFIPHNHGQSMSSYMQGQDRMLPQGQLQSPPQIQAFGQSHPQYGQGQRQSRFPQAFSNSRASNSQGQQQRPPQGQRGIPHRPIDAHQQMFRSSPSAAMARAAGTPTPAPRRRSTVSKAGQKSSPRSDTPRRNVQTPNRRSFQTPNNNPTQNPSFSQTPNQTPLYETPAVLRLHLPTPKQPISTGSCPNTISETLAETNRRTEAELRSLGADVVDYDPNMNWDDTADASFGGLFGGIDLLAPADRTFSDMMGLDMMTMPQDASENVTGLGNTFLTTAVSTGEHTGGLMMTLPSNSDLDATEVPANAATHGIAANFETGTMSTTTAAADLGFACDWPNAFEEGKDFDPMDFGF